MEHPEPGTASEFRVNYVSRPSQVTRECFTKLNADMFGCINSASIHDDCSSGSVFECAPI